MPVKLNSVGAAHARSLINSGKVDNDSPWSFSAEDGNALLGPDGEDWSNYANFHLGEDTDAAENTKARYKYPWGKAGKCYGGALRAIRNRASQQDEKDIYDEAGTLLDLVKSNSSSSARVWPMNRPNARAAGVKPAGYKVIAAADRAEIYLYGPIGASMWGDGISANDFRQDLQNLGAVSAIDVRINSEGGDVFDGQAIYSLLAQHKANVAVHVDGLAASIASLIAMAGNTIEIAESAFMMVHNPSGFCFGEASEMRRTADLLDTVAEAMCSLYAARTKVDAGDVQKLMDAETWMTGKDAVAKGFADKLVPNIAIAASVRDPKIFKRTPQALFPRRAAAQALLKA